MGNNLLFTIWAKDGLVFESNSLRMDENGVWIIDNGAGEKLFIPYANIRRIREEELK